jgi:hypothetical protein
MKVATTAIVDEVRMYNLRGGPESGPSPWCNTYAHTRIQAGDLDGTRRGN